MKKKLGAINVLYPTPTILVGAMVNGKPNFITIAHVGIMTHTHISISMAKPTIPTPELRRIKLSVFVFLQKILLPRQTSVGS
jgi:hypothetical protein